MYTITHKWSILVLFMALLGEGFCMGGYLEKLKIIGKKEIIQNLVEYFDIIEEDNSSHYSSVAINDLCMKIKYARDSYNIYIDLTDLIVNGKKESPETHTKLENTLHKIEGIRCKSLNVDLKRFSFGLVKMLIERMVIECRLNIYGFHEEETPPNAFFMNQRIENLQKKAFLEMNWIICTQISLYIMDCSEIIFKAILNWIGTRKINNMHIRSINIKELDLKQTNLTSQCRVAIKDLSEVESIFFLEEGTGIYGSIELLKLPKLKNITGICNLSYSVMITSLYLDQTSFKVLATICQNNLNGSTRNILYTKTLYLSYMPYTFNKIQNLSSCEWIISKKVIVYIDYCTFCKISIEEVMPNETYLQVLRRVGVMWLKKPVCKPFSAINHFFDIYKCSIELMCNIGNTNFPLQEQYLICSNNMQNSKRKYCLQLPYIKIELKFYEKIQSEIERFQENYDMLPTHTKYNIVDLIGSDNPQNDANLLVKLFACMGHIIKANNISFINMKDFIGEDSPQPNSNLSEIAPFVSMFKVTRICFFNSHENFIRRILDRYSYAPGAQIYIECQSIEKESIWCLCQKIVNYAFSDIFLISASQIVEEFRSKGYITPYIKYNEISLRISSAKWFLEYPLFVKNLFHGAPTLSNTYLFKLIVDKEGQAAFKEKHKRNIMHTLTCYSVVEACSVLQNFKAEICLIAYLNISILKSSTEASTTIEQISNLIVLVKVVFVHVEVLRILDLNIIGEEKQLSLLNEHIDTKNKYKLQYILLDRYIINEDEKSVIAGEKETDIMKYYRIGENYLKYLLKAELLERNVLVDQTALLLFKQSNNAFDASQEPWERDLMDGNKCIGCRNRFKTQKSKTIYILHQCRDWLCQRCARECYEKKESVCPKCKKSMRFAKLSCFLCPKDRTNENLTEDDFEFVENWSI
ncbi:hypothetical protein NEFER03_0785 [Nematocida sp. LUAm3]|nr:hypothetical protein NEFER03_0785 [Nematocida sp. LUAm3]KAI5175244.1 hypothetical protein NEFER02_1205 [Nematocida sp. LUAm2]KAI5178084.1 hypothetical protein NEFER01_1262 [Nematocida sp. LUAm1]